MAAAPPAPAPARRPAAAGGEERPRLAALLAEHGPRVAQLRAALAADLAAGPPEGDPLVYDDVWLLRYVLSFAPQSERGASNAAWLQAAADAARQALRWRREHAALARAAAARALPPGVDSRTLAAFEAFCGFGFHRAPSRFGDLISIVRVGCSDITKLMDEVSLEVVSYMFTYFGECAYQYVDAASREKGYFVKVIQVQDLTGSPFQREKRFFRAMGLATKRHEWLFPQKDMRAVVFRPPSWVSLVFGVAKLFLPASVVERIYIHRPAPLPGQPGCDAARCPFAGRLFDPAQLPSGLGGIDAGTVSGLPAHASGSWGARHPGEQWDAPKHLAAVSGDFVLTAVRELPRPLGGSPSSGALRAETPCPDESAEFFSPRSVNSDGGQAAAAAGGGAPAHGRDLEAALVRRPRRGPCCRRCCWWGPGARDPLLPAG